MSLKNCPFCGGEAANEPDDFYGDEESRRDMCTKCHATSLIWNTRAAPPMKPWVWEVQRDEWFTCLTVEPTYKAKVTMCVGSSVWRAHVDGKYIGEFMFCDAAKNACMILVERKLKEWLVS